jgi:hypothetical protein
MLMPRSKHRRKAGGKSVKRPGHNKPWREAPLTAVQADWQRFGDAYLTPFHQQWRDRAQAGYMLDLVAEAIFDPDTFTFHAAEKAVVLPAFLAPSEEDDGTPVNWTSEDADAALRFLVEENMVVMDGNLISIHPRFLEGWLVRLHHPMQSRARSLPSGRSMERLRRPVRWRRPRLPLPLSA